jgi:hypothetical protein
LVTRFFVARAYSPESVDDRNAKQKQHDLFGGDRFHGEILPFLYLSTPGLACIGHPLKAVVLLEFLRLKNFAKVHYNILAGRKR